MTEQLTGYEASSVAEIGAILDAMPADADTVYLDTIAYSERAIAAVAAKRAGGGGSAGAILANKVTLSSADVYALNGTPVTLVEGVLGSIIVPVYMVALLHAGSTPYDALVNPRVFISDTTYNASGWGHLAGTILPSEQTVDSAVIIVLQTGVLEADAEPLNLLTGKKCRMDTTSGAPSQGDGTIDITIYYSLVAP